MTPSSCGRDEDHAAGLPDVKLRLVAVAAVAENGVIGRGNDLPWRLRTDLRRFRALTIGKPLIVGRRNWDSIGRPLPGREMVVLTRQPGYAAEGAHVVRTWREALDRAADLAARMGACEVVIGGGAEIYRLAMPHLAGFHLTRVHARPPGDVLFPSFDPVCFRESFRESHPAGEGDDHPFTFIDLVRADRRPPGAGDDAGR